jgi:hypothetical protein
VAGGDHTVGHAADGRADRIEAPLVTTPAQDGDDDGKVNEIPLAIVDYLETPAQQLSAGRQTRTPPR